MNAKVNPSELHVIVGAGPLGLAIARELKHQGKKARIVSRSGKVVDSCGAEVVKGDITNPASALNACHGATVLYHCAQAPYHRWPEESPPLMDGIIQTASKLGAKVVYGDNLYMYGEVKGPLKETLPHLAHTRKGIIRSQLANQLLEAHKKGLVRATIGQGSDFYGPHVRLSSVGELVFRNALQGKGAQYLGSKTTPHTYTFIDDFARALVLLGQDERALGQSWHVPNAPTVSAGEFVDMVYGQLGRKTQLMVIPRFGSKLLGLINPMVREVNEVFYHHDQPYIVDHSKFERTFGAQYTPLKDGIQQTLAWYRSAHPELQASGSRSASV
ncbi:NAD-dependent epimerase/dehydratase family protein [Deinococcus roseus]|uniref:NAD-dependent epimerase/dehydratase domain-containing protein n=1 Tax=Deinococcus roseus TaxID=392414 RepID=A0ABQ2CYA5_9DEIO|nr:NAD-dependent epimerase/dehydratase family protein [Deinococcus roseus]GGJ32913.1 hypothetical protein GCM10008938_18940 [Deinococcus roseus]